MVHSASGFRGTRAGVTEGAGPSHQSEDLHGESLPRIRVSYWCAKGHETQPVFIKLPEDQIPAVWDCRRCGAPASRDGRQRPAWTPRTTATKATSNTLKSGAPTRTPKTSWPERWKSYAPAASFRTSCCGTREAAFSSISHKVREVPRGPGRRNLDRVGARQGQAHGAGLVLACHHHPDFGGGVDGRQRQRDPQRRRLGGVVDANDGPFLLPDAALLRKQRRHVGVGANAQQDNVQPRKDARFVRAVIGHVGGVFGLGCFPEPARVVLGGLLRACRSRPRTPAAWIRAGSTGMCDEQGLERLLGVPVGSSAPTKRSSPHQKFTFDQSTAGAAGESATAFSVPMPTVPPVSTTVASPYLSCTSTSLVIRRAAMAAIRTDESG